MHQPSERTYEGRELDLFSHAQNWKRYFAKAISPYIGKRIAEVGAGNGSTTEILSSAPHDTWFALEPDPSLIASLNRKRELGHVPDTVTPILGGLAEIESEAPLDTILYIDVLEHIPDDTEEIRRAAMLLAPAGHLIVLSPAYQMLYTPFDAAIGHHRRYTLEGLKRLTPNMLRLQKGFYLDSVGVLASVANLLFLNQSQPKLSQVLFWDRVLVPCSKVLDALTAHTFGRSVVAIWRRHS